APIKKERFVVSYNKAREEALSDRVIRAGWKAAGLCPYSPGLVLSSSQVTGRPSTPPPTQASAAASASIFNTPQSSQALYRAQQQLLLSESLSRSTRLAQQASNSPEKEAQKAAAATAALTLQSMCTEWQI
nr:hypothetical protein [Tanacetum cinerariifolium]